VVTAVGRLIVDFTRSMELSLPAETFSTIDSTPKVDQFLFSCIYLLFILEKQQFPHFGLCKVQAKKVNKVRTPQQLVTVLMFLPSIFYVY